MYHNLSPIDGLPFALLNSVSIRQVIFWQRNTKDGTEGSAWGRANATTANAEKEQADILVRKKGEQNRKQIKYYYCVFELKKKKVSIFPLLNMTIALDEERG